MVFPTSISLLAGLVGFALATPLEVIPRHDDDCPMGYSHVWVQTQVIQYPWVVNQYFEDNTNITINGGVTININNAPTSVVTSGTVTTTSTVTTTVTVGATTVPTPFILIVTQGTARKRQAGSLYIGAGGAAVTDCQDALTWSLTDGQLSSGGELVSVDQTLNSIPFSPSASTGSISQTFSQLGANIEWTNQLFFNSAAVFCILNNQVSINFQQASDACTTVSVAIGSVCSSSSSSVASTSASSSVSSTAPASTTASSSTSSESSVVTSSSSSSLSSSSSMSITSSSTSQSSSSTSSSASSTSTGLVGCAVALVDQTADVTLLNNLKSGGVAALLNSLTLGSGGAIVGTTLAQVLQALQDVVACGLTTTLGATTCITGVTSATANSANFLACLVTSISGSAVPNNTVAGLLTTLLTLIGGVTGGSVSSLLTANPLLATALSTFLGQL